MILSVRAALFIVIYGISAGAAGRFFLFIDEKSNGQLTQLAEAATANREQILEKAKNEGVPTAVLDAMLSGDLPFLVVTVLFFSTFVIPALILLIGYGSVGEDLHTRFARYLLQRVRRGSFLAGKIAAHFIVSFLAIVIVHLLLLAAAQLLDNFDTEKTLHVLPRIWGAMAIFTLAYVAFTSIFSTLVKPPFAAFALGLMTLAIIWVVSKFSPFDRIWMGALDLELAAMNPTVIAIYAGHIAVFFAIAWFGLQRRDV
jgi:ABC-type transport system involved in multi-copper enzyme maturation permease subunit